MWQHLYNIFVAFGKYPGMNTTLVKSLHKMSELWHDEIRHFDILSIYWSQISVAFLLLLFLIFSYILFWQNSGVIFFWRRCPPAIVDIRRKTVKKRQKSRQIVTLIINNTNSHL